jgi:predicted DNA-binding transcriptional regulator YafY
MDSHGRHEQLLRVFHLIDILLGAARSLSAVELKTALLDRGVVDDISERNIRRDIGFLESFGYDVREEGRREGRGAMRKAWRIEPAPGLSFPSAPAVTVPEILSLAVARDFLVPLAGTCYWRGIGQLIQRIERLATPALLDYVDRHREGLILHPRPTGGKYAVKLLNAVHRAIRQSLELSIGYRGVADEEPRTIRIEPEALVVYDGSIYVAAHVAAARPSAPSAVTTIRFFKLDRVIDARVTERSFEPRAGDVAALLADSMTMFRSPAPPRRFRIRVAPSRARWACERPFHPRQEVVSQPDGSVILEIARGWEEEMIPQLLGLAGEAEVLEPVDVRERMLAAARSIAELYEREPVAAAAVPRPRRRRKGPAGNA